MNQNRVVLVAAVLVGVLIVSLSIIAWGSPMLNHMRFGGSSSGSLSIDDAKRLADEFLARSDYSDLAVDEIMEFQYNFYIVYYEKSTGVGAFEAVIDKGSRGMMEMMGSGYVRFEQGPGMMWNTKYAMHGMMRGRSNAGNMSVTVDGAKMLAQEYLDAHYVGVMVGDVHEFYGYYTVHVVRDGVVSGMLSVNGYSGQVWYHNWHGTYIKTLEIHV